MSAALFCFPVERSGVKSRGAGAVASAHPIELLRTMFRAFMLFDDHKVQVYMNRAAINLHRQLNDMCTDDTFDPIAAAVQTANAYAQVSATADLRDVSLMQRNLA